MNKLNKKVADDFKLLMPLKPIKQDKKPVWGFDIETYGSLNRFILGSVTNGKDYYRFRSPKQMLKFLLSKNLKNSYVFATNLQFDLLGLLKEAPDYKDKLRINFHKGRLINATYKIPDSKNRIDIFDTVNFIPLSVARMGKILGIHKMEHPSFFTKKPRNEKEYRILQEYCDNDALITCKFSELLKSGFNKMGAKMKCTVASTSMDLFRRKYLGKPLIQPRRDQIELQYNGYYGGRTEVFKRGLIKNMNYYDVNSLYPHVMLNKFPHPNNMVHDKNPKRNVIEYEGISKVTIISNEDYYPVLPIKHDGKLKFMNGKFKEEWFNHIELRNAVNYGYRIIKFHESYYSTKNFYPFKKYVTDLYNQRMKYKKQGSPMEHLTKLGLNSLYGKFAQKIEDKEEIIHANNLTYKQLCSKKCERVGEWFYISNPTTGANYGRFILPMLSNSVTAYSRTLLYDLLVKSKAYYTDTDSIITKKKLNVSSKLGDLKLEYRIKEGVLVKPKMYFLATKKEEIIKLKGVGNKVKSMVDFYSILNGNPVECNRFAKFREANRRGFEWNQIIELTKQISLDDNKRLWNNEFHPDHLSDSKPLKI